MKQFDPQLLEKLLDEGRKDEARKMLEGFFLDETPEKKIDDALLYAFIKMTLANSVDSVYNDLLQEGIREARQIQAMDKKVQDVSQVNDLRNKIQDV